MPQRVLPAQPSGSGGDREETGRTDGRRSGRAGQDFLKIRQDPVAGFDHRINRERGRSRQNTQRRTHTAKEGDRKGKRQDKQASQPVSLQMGRL